MKCRLLHVRIKLRQLDGNRTALLFNVRDLDFMHKRWTMEQTMEWTDGQEMLFILPHLPKQAISKLYELIMVIAEITFCCLRYYNFAQGT